MYPSLVTMKMGTAGKRLLADFTQELKRQHILNKKHAVLIYFICIYIHIYIYIYIHI